MKYVAYKLNFKTGVHFGNGMLNETKDGFLADTLYSALCIEALRNDCLERFHKMTTDGRLLFSDGFPFIKDRLYIPKPMIKLEHGDDVSDRKKWKKLKYVPIDCLDAYLKGKLDVDKESALLGNLGKRKIYQKVSLTNAEKSEPYSVGVYYFEKENGLYFLMGYEEEEDRAFVEPLIDSLGYQGIGGKVSAGLGKFRMLPVELSKNIKERFQKEDGTFVLLSVALPMESELADVISDASYLLEKRSGFIQSDCYAEDMVKKQELYVLKSGSVIHKRFHGDVYNVGTKGTHPVWRYAKPILMEVSV